jgi:hypothetical protein
VRRQSSQFVLFDDETHRDMQLLLEIDPTDNNPKALNLRKTIGPVGGYFVQIEFKALR